MSKVILSKIISKIFFFISVSLFWQTSTCWAKVESVVINEIAWAGSKNDYTKEWIELYNPTDKNININGWRLIDRLGKINIVLKGKITPFSFFTLERTSEETLPDIKADFIYTGALKNSGGYLMLINKRGKIVDEVNCKEGWFAGDNKTKRTMERRSAYVPGSDPKNWQTSIYPSGTPKRKNLVLSLKKQAENTPDKEKISLKTFSAKNSFLSQLLLANISSFSLTFLFSKFKFNRRKKNY